MKCQDWVWAKKADKRRKNVQKTDVNKLGRWAGECYDVVNDAISLG